VERVVPLDPPSSGGPSVINCVTCGKENEDFFKFCLGCGSELATAKPEPKEALQPEPPADWPLHNTSPEMEALSDSVISEVLREAEEEEEEGIQSSAKFEFEAFSDEEDEAPAAEQETPAEQPTDDSKGERDRPRDAVLMGGLPDPDDIVTIVRPALGSAETARQCRVCTAGIPLDFTYCAVCGAPAVFQRSSGASELDELGLTAAGEPRGQLVLLREDGVDRASYDLDSNMTVLGREECQISFPSDEFLALNHAVFTYRGDRLVVRPFDTTNGIFLRLRDEVEISSGDSFRMGQELLVYQESSELLAAGRAEDESSTRWLGSALSTKVWGRLSQRLGPGMAANAFLLERDDIYLGRDRGQITFPKDGYVSGCHAVLARRGGSVFLKDLDSSNGTYIRLKEEVVLTDGDQLLIGQQLLRVEPGN
jgi:pSer/pThr/pTyr-binding forkhead associated (FHA) protein